MSYSNLSLEEAMLDLQSRFLINVPLEERNTAERIFFQLEKAHWFYEDFFVGSNSNLQHLSFREFTLNYFKYCQLLNDAIGDHADAMKVFVKYRSRVPVCGAIILDEDMDKVILVKGYKAHSSWHYPRGKINEKESDVDCAIREVHEEVGIDISPYVNEDEYHECWVCEQRVKLYFIHGVPSDVKLGTNTKNEIGDIKWHSLACIPGWSKPDAPSGPAAPGCKYYMVSRFFQPMRKYIHSKRLRLKAEACVPDASVDAAPPRSTSPPPLISKEDGLHARRTPRDSEREVISESQLRGRIRSLMRAADSNSASSEGSTTSDSRSECHYQDTRPKKNKKAEDSHAHKARKPPHQYGITTSAAPDAVPSRGDSGLQGECAAQAATTKPSRNTTGSASKQPSRLIGAALSEAAGGKEAPPSGKPTAPQQRSSGSCQPPAAPVTSLGLLDISKIMEAYDR